MIKQFLLQQLLKETASKFPEKIAIKDENRCITYKEIDEKSNSLANLLISTGFKPRNVVGVYLHKSIEALIAIFAALKAGGAYIPLDSHYSPLSRIKDIIRLSEAEYVLTDENQWNSITANSSQEEDLLNQITVIFIKDTTIDAEGDEKDSSKDSNNTNNTNKYYYKDSQETQLIKEPGTIDADLAYILYTSGSTGIPKGVMLTHRNALTFINWALSYFKPSAEDVFSSFAPFHFDLSVFDIYVSVATGACLNLVPFRCSNNPRALLEWISESKISFMYSVPSIWVSIMNYANINENNLMQLKNILFAGEVFAPKYLRKLMELIPHASFYNLYGPTETNVCTCFYVESREMVTDKPVPIGSACSNTEVIALNQHKQPIALGEEGELLVRGSIVTKGYYKDHKRTETAFIKSPLQCHNGALFYKTGDIVRKCGEDLYEFVGRNDSMIKCQGFRVELQEIEHALYRNEDIEEAVVIPLVIEEKARTAICAVLKAKEGSNLLITNIKNFVAEILPKYMVPEVIRIIDELPKNSNGKADRQKLIKWLQDN